MVLHFSAHGQHVHLDDDSTRLTVSLLEPLPKRFLSGLHDSLDLAAKAQGSPNSVVPVLSTKADPFGPGVPVAGLPLLVGLVSILKYAVNVPKREGRVLCLLPGHGNSRTHYTSSRAKRKRAGN